jgi:hypothetical protein
VKPHEISLLPRRRVLLILAAAAIAPACAPLARPRAGSGPARGKTYRFAGGRWFDGRGFAPREFYSVDGAFTARRPAVIDEVVELGDGYIIPPFADAHTHHFDNPANIDRHVAMYLNDGVFYAKVQTDVRSRALQVADRVNRPDSVDVAYAHGGLSASNGHPLATYEGLALYGRPGARADQVRQVRDSRLVDNDAYYIIDTAADLAGKWPAILAGKPDFIKVYLLYSEDYETRRLRNDTVGDRGLDPALVPLIVERAHAAGLRVSAHVQTAADYRSALAAGVDEMAHLPGSSIPAAADPRVYELGDADARDTARRGIWVIPAPAYYPAYDPADAAFDAAAKARTEAVRIRNLERLRRNRVKIAFGSDSFGRSPVKDVLYLATLGVFRPAELLKIWCEDTPRTIFPDRKLGLLAEGYEASFLVLDGDPTVNLAEVANIGLMCKQGHLFRSKP